jgi:roadblock/LC7 domain-containing protein
MSETTPTTPPPESPPPAPPPAPSSGGFGPGGGYPIGLEFERDYDVQNWRPVVNWLLAIPQWIVLYVLGIVAFVLWVISLFVILFTQRNPFVGFQTMYLRYYWRVASFAGFLRNEYPPFDFATDDATVVPDSAVVTVDDPGDMNRFLGFVKWLLAFPHYIVLWLLEIAVFVVLVINFFIVLFTGRWNEAMRDFVVGVARWHTRVYGYVFLLTDRYPPFTLQ